MRRKLQLLFLLLLIAGTTATGVHASTDCERWMAAYKAQLAQTKAARRLQAAHARVKHAAQRKLANYVKKPSAPKPLRVHSVRPRYTRQQMLDRFNVACGDLPDGAKPTDELVEGKKTPAQLVAQMTPYEPVGPLGSDDGGLIPSGDTPPYTPPGTGGGDGPGGGSVLPPIYGGGPGGGGGGGGTTPGGGGGTPGGGGGDNPPPVTTVPEPGTLLMVLTGIAGAAGTVRRRMQR